MALTNRNLEPGTVLVARYKGTEHRCEVVAGEDGKPRYRLPDGREFTSPSAAGSAVMGGVACNGWRFWSLEGELPAKAEKPKARGKAERGAKPKPKGGAKTKGAKGGAKSKAGKNGSGRIACAECGEGFPHARAAAEHMRAEHGSAEAKPGDKA